MLLKWTQHDPNVSPGLISIVEEDIQGLMEVVSGTTGSNLDLILHSPGGSLEAAEAFLNYLRSKFQSYKGNNTPSCDVSRDNDCMWC